MVYIQNQYGSWSQVILISAPHPNQMRLRIRGYEPSFVFVDELTSCESSRYFTSIAAQLGRRLYIDGPQQYVAATNPEGQEHWVYQTFFIEPFDEETGEWDKDYHLIYFPIADNIDNLVAGYAEGLKKIYKYDTTESLRMVGGEWISRPSGTALFKDIYNPMLHVRPLDENGNKEGFNDMRCFIEARLEKSQPIIAITNQADTVELAVSGAISKLKASLEKMHERSKTY